MLLISFWIGIAKLEHRITEKVGDEHQLQKKVIKLYY